MWAFEGMRDFLAMQQWLHRILSKAGSCTLCHASESDRKCTLLALTTCLLKKT